LEMLASRLMDFAEGKTRRLLINLPPRHLKTQLCTVSFAAWILAHKPDTKIMLITYGQDLATDIAGSIRGILQADWYRSLFKARIAKGRGKVRNFVTTAGGHVYATSFDGSITGFGADIILVDDPHNATDLSAHRIEQTILQFNSVVVGRLNNPDEGRILVVGHRVDENDLSANVIENGEWTQVVLPVMAVKTKTYDTRYGPWQRKKGDVLRAKKYDRRRIENLRRTSTSPPFGLYYQQGAEAKTLPAIKPTHFPTYEPIEVEALPRFISVDPGMSDGENSSFSVAQIWVSNGVDFFLIDQFRQRCRFDELAKNMRTLAKRYHGAPILIEDTATGPALFSALTRKQRRRAEGIRPVDSKVVRFARHVDKIVGGKIRIPKSSAFNGVFVDELIRFPKGPYDDQVDAMTQFLDWLGRQDDIDFSKTNAPHFAIGAIANGYQPLDPCLSTRGDIERPGTCRQGET
jgi:predicted phage terminase large subunit-like protein